MATATKGLKASAKATPSSATKKQAGEGEATPRARAVRPLPELTRDNLVTGVRTLLTMAACWELRDPTETQVDRLQKLRLRRVFRELAEGAAMQEEAATQVIVTLIHDELAVALDPTLAEPTFDESEFEDTPGVFRVRKRPRGNEIVSRQFRAAHLPRALWPSGAMFRLLDVPEDDLASAIRRCNWILAWLFQYQSPDMTVERAVKLADATRRHARERKLGVQEAVSGALGVFVGEREPRSLVQWDLAARKFATYTKRWLAKVRHPDRPALLPENVDTGRYFGARDQVEARFPQWPVPAPLSRKVAELIGDAMALRAPSIGKFFEREGEAPAPDIIEALIMAEANRFPGLLESVARGASNPSSGDRRAELLGKVWVKLGWVMPEAGEGEVEDSNTTV